MSDLDRYEMYRIITDYDALREMFADRIEDLNVTRDTVDATGGFTPGYSAKLLCDPPMKRMGQGTLEKMLRVTGIALIAVIDDERFAPVKAEMAKRKKKYDPAKLLSRKKEKEILVGFLGKIGRKGGRRRLETMTQEQRIRIARKAGRARARAARSRQRHEEAIARAAALSLSATASQAGPPDSAQPGFPVPNGAQAGATRQQDGQLQTA